MSDAIAWAERELEQARRNQNAIEQRIKSVEVMVEDQVKTAARITGDVAAGDLDHGMELIREAIREGIFWKALANAEERARDADGRLARLIEEDERRAYQAALL